MQFVLTTAGQLLIQANPGVAPNLQAYKLGSGFNYTPSVGQTDLLGLEVHSGVPSNPVVQASNLVKYTIFLDFSLGDFNFGEVALYAPGNVLFAIGTSTTQIPKVKSSVNADGNALSIDCYIPTSGTTYAIYAELGNSDLNINIPALPGIDSLPPAYIAVPNTYQVSSPGQLSSVLAFSNNSRWSVTGYDTELHADLTVDVGSTAGTIVFTQPATNPTTVGELLLQGVTGLNTGSIRVISGYSAGNSSYSVTNAFLYTPQVGDTFSVVRRNYLTPTAIGFLNGLNPGVGAGQTNGLQSIDLNKIFMTDGSRPAINNLNFADYRLTSVGDPLNDKDAVHKLWVTDAIDTFNTNVVTPIANAPKVQIGIGAPIGTIPTTPPFYADKSVAGRYDLYINDPSTSAWTRVYPTDAQYGTGAPVLGTTPTLPSLYYDTSVSSRYIPYIFRSGDWHRVGYVDPGINFVGGVTVSDSIAVGQAYPNPLNMTGIGFQTSNPAGINFDMKSIGINANLRNRWPSTYAVTLNTSNNETGTYELCRNNTAFGGMRIIEDGSIHVGSKGLNSFYLVYNNAPVAAISTGFFDIFPTYNAGGLLRVNSRTSSISGVSIGSKGTANNIAIGNSAELLTTGTLNIALGHSSLGALTTGQYNVALGTSAAAALVSGSSNTILGSVAFSTAPAGNSNVVIGDSAGSSSVLAHGRTIIGTGSDSSGTNTVTVGGLSYTGSPGQIAIGFSAKGGTGVNSISIGTQAMEFAANTDFTVGIGYQALRNNSGSYNTALGYRALTSNTTGVRNTAIGVDVALSNTIGNDNTFVGASSGSNNTGSSNSSLGSQALLANVSGALNTAIGFGSATSNVTGVENTAVGANSLRSSTVGSVNCAFGAESLYSNTSGFANCGFGDRSLRANTTGVRNVALGGSSLILNTTGSDNIGIGATSLGSMSSGSYNTAIGTGALYSNTTGSDIIAIGSYSLSSAVTGVTNAVAVGKFSSFSVTSSANSVSIGYSANKSSSILSNAVCIGSLTCEQVSNILGDVYIGDEAGRLTTGTSSGTVTDSVYVGRKSSYSRSGLGINNVAVGSKTFESSTSDYTVALGARAARSGTHTYSVEIGTNTGSVSGSYSTSILIGYDCLGGAASVGTVAQSTIIGAKAFQGATVNSITNSIIIGDDAYNSGGTISLNRVILIDGQASSTSASNEVTIGNGLYTTYRMYAAGWSNVSDARDKKNIRPLSDGLDLINKLNPVRFEWDTRDGTRTGVEDSGFIAQDLQEALGEANEYLKVVNESNPEHLMVTKDGLYPVIVKALQELSAQNKQMRAELDALLNK